MTNVIEAKSVAQAEVPRLFYVTSTGIVNGYHDVPIDWYAARGSDELGADLPWPAIIKDYDPNDQRTKEAVAEMFTEDEARALVQYLERTDPKGAPVMKPVKLPIPPFFIIPTEEWAEIVDNRITFPLNPDDDGCSLSFPVKGYCRIAGRLLVREERSAFVVYRDATQVSTPFADRAEAEEWMSHASNCQDFADRSELRRTDCEDVASPPLI